MLFILAIFLASALKTIKVQKRSVFFCWVFLRFWSQASAVTPLKVRMSSPSTPRQWSGVLTFRFSSSLSSPVAYPSCSMGGAPSGRQPDAISCCTSSFFDFAASILVTQIVDYHRPRACLVFSSEYPTTNYLARMQPLLLFPTPQCQVEPIAIVSSSGLLPSNNSIWPECNTVLIVVNVLCHSAL